MRTNNVPPRHTHFRGARVPSASNQQSRILRFKREDLYEFLDTAVHPSKHRYIESLFPIASRDRHMMMMDKSRFDKLLRALDSGEKESLQRMLSEANSTIVKVGRMPEAEAAKVKDSGRLFLDGEFPSVPHKTPQPAKGEDLKAPIDSHGAGPIVGAKHAKAKLPPSANGMSLARSAKVAGPKLPPDSFGMSQGGMVKPTELKLPIVVPKQNLSSLTQNQLPVPSAKAKGNPNAAAANTYVTWADLVAAEPKHKTLEEFLAEERASRNSSGSSQTQTPPKRVRFADQAEVRKYPVGEDFQPGELHSGSQHDVSFDRVGLVRKYRPLTNPESIPEKPNHETQGQEASYILDNPSYPPPPPKGIMTNHTPGPIKTPFLGIGTKKALLGSAAALGAGAAVGGIIVGGLMAGSQGEDSSSSTPT